MMYLRKKLANGLRWLAGTLHEDTTWRVSGLYKRFEKENGLVISMSGPGQRLYLREDEYDNAWKNGTEEFEEGDYRGF